MVSRILEEFSQGVGWGEGTSRHDQWVLGEEDLAGSQEGLGRYQGIAGLGQRDEVLVSGCAHVQADGQHLFQCGHDERCLY